jgi:hypothetical protein
MICFNRKEKNVEAISSVAELISLIKGTTRSIRSEKKITHNLMGNCEPSRVACLPCKSNKVIQPTILYNFDGV